MLYTIKGKVTGKDGLPIRRRLFAYNRESGDRISETYSDYNTGEYTLVAYTPNPVMVICQPNSGETLNAIVYDNVTPIMVANDTPTGIGIPGTAGFGVGVAPDLPTGFIPLSGHNNPYHENYGNYQYMDGSIMCWIPAFYYKWGDGTNGLGLNICHVKDYSDYASEALANNDGYALHRAFIDGGEIKKGFFIDKYECGKNPTKPIASSMPGLYPMSPSSTNNSITQVGATNYVHGILVAAKTRGTDFFCASIFMFNALSVLSKAHGDNSISKDFCGWYGTVNKFPKGCNNSTNWDHCTFDNTVKTFRYNANFPTNCANGWNYPEKITHNGMKSGVSEVTGSLNNTGIGALVLWTTEYKTYVLKETVAVKDLAYKSGFNIIHPANYDEIPTTALAQGQVLYYKNDALVFPVAFDRNSNDYKSKSIGLPIANSVTTTKVTNQQVSGIFYNKLSTETIFSAGGWYGDDSSGVFTMSSAVHLTLANSANSGFRCGYYV